jgi:hypothetical protein
MLEHKRHDRRQLPLLMNDRITQQPLAAIEPMPTRALARQLLEAPIDLLWPGHLLPLALMLSQAGTFAETLKRGIRPSREELHVHATTKEVPR